MSSGETTITGILLAREASGERFWKLTLVSPDAGIVCCLLRISKKTTTPAPDLFDEAEISLDAAHGSGPRFAGDYRIVRRETALGADYARLALACRFALLLAKNPPPDDTAGEIFSLCRDALCAFSERPRPDCTLLKTLWKLAKIEGYPVREHWLRELSAGVAGDAVSIITQPLDMQTATPEVAARLTRGLETWLARECHFVPAE